MKNSAFQNTNPGSFVMSRLLKDDWPRSLDEMDQHMKARQVS